MKKPTIEKTIKTATALFNKAVDEKVILKCLIRDGFSLQQIRVMMLWAKRSFQLQGSKKHEQKVITLRQKRTPESA